MNPRTTLIATVAIIIIIALGLFFYVRSTPAPSGTGTTATSTNATSTTDEATSTAAFTLAQPDYTKPIAFDASMGLSSDIQAELNQELATAQAQIKANPLNMGAWVNLGTIHKQGGDYANAALYWEYVTSVYEGPDSPFYSLGDLYQNFLHNNTKAEADYLEAIKINPQNVNAYASLASLYQSEGESSQASSTIAAGLKANPGNTYLESLQ